MIEVIAFEGACGEHAPLCWGAAAVLDSAGLVRNAVTQRTSREPNLHDLGQRRAVTLIDPPIRLKSTSPDHPLVVLSIPRNSPAAEIAKPDLGKPGLPGEVLAASHRTDVHLYVFESPDGLRAYARRTISRIIAFALAGDESEAAARSYLDVGLALDPGHGMLNALYVYLAEGDDPMAEAFSLAQFNDTKEFSEFNLFLAACRSDRAEQSYVLKYRGGMAEGGGFDVHNGYRTLHALHKIHKHMQVELRRQFPFMKGKSPEPRIREVRDRSAELHLVPSIPQGGLRDRLARYLELNILSEMISGNVPESLQQDAELATALETVRRPSPDTVLLHRPLGQSEVRPVLPSDIEPDPDHIVQHEVTTLGYKTGIYKDFGRVELRVFPGRHWRLSVPIDDDGFGEKPKNVEMIIGGPALSGLALLTLLRRVTPSGKESWFLRSVRLLKEGERAVLTGFPSSVVPSAVVLTEVELDISDGQLRLGPEGTQLSATAAHDISATHDWIGEYAKLCADIEFTSNVRWAPPSRGVKHTALVRILEALPTSGERLPVDVLVRRINEAHEVDVRVNNTRREILANPHLVELTNDKTAAITQRGVSYLRAFRAISAATPA